MWQSSADIGQMWIVAWAPGRRKENYPRATQRGPWEARSRPEVVETIRFPLSLQRETWQVSATVERARNEARERSSRLSLATRGACRTGGLAPHPSRDPTCCYRSATLGHTTANRNACIGGATPPAEPTCRQRSKRHSLANDSEDQPRPRLELTTAGKAERALNWISRFASAYRVGACAGLLPLKPHPTVPSERAS